MRDRRFDPREALDKAVTLSWIDSSAHPVRADADLRDLSYSGAQVRVDQPIAVLTMVEMDTQSRLVRGKVKYCTRSGSSFLIGLEFETV